MADSQPITYPVLVSYRQPGDRGDVVDAFASIDAAHERKQDLLKRDDTAAEDYAVTHAISDGRHFRDADTDEVYNDETGLSSVEWRRLEAKLL